MPAAPRVPLEEAEPWHPPPDVARLRADPSFVADGALLYVHVPYCDFFCHYCPLYKTLAPDDYRPSEQARYVDALCKEIAAYARRVAPGRVFRAVYFGGGTPTSLPAPLFRRIMACIRDETNLASDAEITVEGIPTHFARTDCVAELVGLGVNRLSFGAQSFEPTVRKHLGRRDTAEECAAAIERARAAGIEHVNVDMMYGYPGQTLEMFERDVLAVKALGPDSVDFYYQMQIMGTPYRQMIAKARLGSSDAVIPLAGMRARLLDLCSDWLQVTAECFSRTSPVVPRIWSHTFGGESGAAEVIAVGPSSYGQVAGHYYFNHATLGPWQQAIEAGHLPLRGRLALGGRTLALRVLFGSILLGRIPARLAALFPRDLQRRIASWTEEGLLEAVESGHRLSRAGQERFQMLQCACVPPLQAFVMMRTYMMTFEEQRKLLFKDTDLLYARSVAAMVRGSGRTFGGLRGLAYRLLLRLPDRVLEQLVALVRRLVAGPAPDERITLNDRPRASLP
ncbi:coproporphyrinogen-III oxidase family protein [Nannocystis pusilla]|uniref:Radical SAM protein n=1 Tax=Nannocystis pusilla TaxID=889268 RepID=A0ABS7TLX6_9BACT|nr:radical SAM protein [Nannocystis pusilla]